MARKLPSYGSIQFCHASVDYPKANNNVNIIIGNKELAIQTVSQDGNYHETKFKITRMRCWRVTTNYSVSKQHEAKLFHFSWANLVVSNRNNFNLFTILRTKKRRQMPQRMWVVIAAVVIL